ncbi:uncharacterized protein KLLA0_C19184g [Kluyveromyces lactis]|uniref:Probable cyclodipeptide synthase PUL1 n=1 Tax=Kluyveromyces lactis (strain ATCC 8585 / CBS 2359 / DSM 70799 / NBRC 1267 / NRRL Y-1140 / WM37) TaxID=284590 RepID=PUL1_KLULA|nr:uncharacterized protein KLLA0_C19184g [Kluyveromyces lactis]Q6CSN3.1 RecName: Full=Probable cyclodipeptide synthase PUL1; Short=CDPS PUL1; AltName: Full=Pulcherrimin biosynthesis cluster protein 1 [Kluyveromyces lactis NRRL Y-1140]CAH01907.1 KLLA0C19184p [Kluyveromyces lactis]|eukprot:XP_453056.1 uncharacterized protein KLLA0_C19184g [Kluyveromyces lactis]
MYQLLFQRLGVTLTAGNDKKTSIPSNQLVGHLIGLILLCDDLNEAFADFQALLQNGIAISSSDRGYLVFDAHVTDCGCHLRAQMIQDVFSYFKNHEVTKLYIFDAVAKKLNELKRHCISLIQTLCWENTSAQKLGFPKNIKSYEELLKLLQWDTADISSAIADSFPMNPNNADQNEKGLVWNVTKLEVVLEFLYCSHFLSKNKIYNKKENLDSVTIDFNNAFEKRQLLSNKFHCQGTGKLGVGCRYLKHAKQSKNSFISVVSNLQSRLALLSIAFLKSRCTLPCDIEALQKNSPRNVSAIPNFLHFLILEREWSQNETPILLAVRKLHEHEHCDLYFEARINPHTFEWTLQHKECCEFEHHTPYIVITALATGSSTTKTAQLLAWELMKAQKNFRQFWLTFMSQHRQYPFEIEHDEDQLLETQVSQDIFELYCQSKREDRNQILFDDSTSLLPKHIFTEYPSIFFNFQKNVCSKHGALVI